MNLSELRDKHGPTALKELADRVRKNPVYLSQCASGFRNPSFKLAKEIDEASQADDWPYGRLSKHELRPDIFERPAA